MLNLFAADFADFHKFLLNRFNHLICGVKEL